ncbi:hypothetical protein ACRAWB_11285 [Leifsonia poae]|uniref:hypothetical protein n=1 Tax=Leifsonia poae TaxID=110933 RepID=UPI003D6953EA
MDVAWLGVCATVLTSLVGAVATVNLIAREAGTLRRIERITELIPKLDAASQGVTAMTQLRDRLIERYVLVRTDPRRLSMRLALWALAFYISGFACFGISFLFAFTPSWAVWNWAAIGMWVVGMVLISLAERRLSSSSPSAAMEPK